MMKRISIALACLTIATASFAQNEAVGLFRDTYLIGGATKPSSDQTVVDLKFQFSLKLYPIKLGGEWTAFAGYTQVSVWNIFEYSCPFKDNCYMPGIYFSDNRELLLGIEHRSNGRPYKGTPQPTPTYDDCSRAMNYAFVQWDKALSAHSTIRVYARAGVSAGIGYERRDNDFTQDLFKYQGYATLGYIYNAKKLCFRAFVTPVGNKSIANVQSDMTFRLWDNAPDIYLQFNYGFEECLSDCVPGNPAPLSLRMGLIL